MLDHDTVQFLADLDANNDKAWFEANRGRYEQHWLGPARAFVNELGPRLADISSGLHASTKNGGSIFRIHRDTRFSKDKTPYKTHLDMMFWEGAGRSRECPGLFFRLTPTELVLGGGMHGFAKEVLASYRQAVAGEPGAELEALLSRVPEGWDIGDVSYKRVPRGFDKEHPRGELLRHGALHVGRTTPHPASLGTPAFIDEVLQAFEAAYPLVGWLLGITEPLKG